MLNVVRTEADDAFDRTFQIIRTRIDKFGVTQPNINAQKNAGRIVVELPGVKEPERVRKLLQASAQLEFWEMYENSPEMGRMLGAANKEVKEALDATGGVAPAATDTAGSPMSSAAAINDTVQRLDNAAPDGTQAAITDTANALGTDTGTASLLGGNDTSTTAADSLNQEKLRRENPLFAIFQQMPQPGPLIGYINGADTAKFNSYLAMPGVRGIFPSTMRFVYGAKPIESEEARNILPVYAIQSQTANFKPPLDGSVIVDARDDISSNQDVVVSMQMNAEGARQWRKITSENINKSVAIVLDDLVYSAPVVQNEIPNGNSQITGDFTIEEAKDLANILKAGKLPAPARIVEENVVGPTLGTESIRAGLLSLAVGVLAVLLYMFIFYSSAGIVANIAVLINLFFVVGILASMGASLTLPGMAGIVLTVGMSVDANVLIFERIKEELRRGAALKKAIADGYSKSWSAILKLHVTSLVTSIILFYFGLGPGVGFCNGANHWYRLLALHRYFGHSPHH